MSATQTNAAAVCLDMGMAQLDETIQQAWAGMSAQERGNCSGAYSAWNSLKLAYDATTVVSVVRGGIASIKYLTGLLRLNRSFSRFVTGGKAIYNAVKSRTLSAPMGRMGARMERYVEWGRGGRFFGKHSTLIDNAVLEIPKEKLFGSTASTFLESEYRTVLSKQQIVLFRCFGGDAKMTGTFVTTQKGVSREALALLDEWNNTMRFEATIVVPSGTKMNIGKVGPQTSKNGLQSLPGGGDQVVLPFQWNTQWVQKITDNITGKVYNSVSDFKIDFPDLVN